MAMNLCVLWGLAALAILGLGLGMQPATTQNTTHLDYQELLSSPSIDVGDQGSRCGPMNWISRIGAR